MTKCPFCDKDTHTSFEEIVFYHPEFKELLGLFMKAFNEAMERKSREWAKSKVYKKE